MGPSFALKKDGPTLAIPVKIGVSLSNYYQSGTEDKKFGFFDIGGLLTVPLSPVPSRFGSWNVHGGGDYLHLGDTTAAFNADTDGSPRHNQFVGLIGVGVTY